MVKDVRTLLVEAKADYEAVFGVKEESWWKGTNGMWNILKIAQMKLDLLNLDYYERSLKQKNDEAQRRMAQY